MTVGIRPLTFRRLSLDGESQHHLATHLHWLLSVHLLQLLACPAGHGGGHDGPLAGSTRIGIGSICTTCTNSINGVRLGPLRQETQRVFVKNYEIVETMKIQESTRQDERWYVCTLRTSEVMSSDANTPNLPFVACLTRHSSPLQSTPLPNLHLTLT